MDNIYWVLMCRSHAFATWKAMALYHTQRRAYEEHDRLGGGYKYKVERVELKD